MDKVKKRQKNKKFILDLAKTKISVQEQEAEFVRVIQMSRATFYRYRLKLGLRTKNKSFRYGYKIEDKCYFCSKDSGLIHHINQNQNDNRQENRIPLCRSCHVKLHRVLNTR